MIEVTDRHRTEAKRVVGELSGIPWDHAAERYKWLIDQIASRLAAEERVKELEAKHDRLRADFDALCKDTVDGMECLPTCDSYGHDDACPVAYPVNAWRLLRAELEKARRERDYFKEKWHTALSELDVFRADKLFDALHKPLPPQEKP